MADGLGFEVSHPSDNNKDGPMDGAPEVFIPWGGSAKNQLKRVYWGRASPGGVEKVSVVTVQTWCLSRRIVLQWQKSIDFVP